MMRWIRARNAAGLVFLDVAVLLHFVPDGIAARGVSLVGMISGTVFIVYAWEVFVATRRSRDCKHTQAWCEVCWIPTRPPARRGRPRSCMRGPSKLKLNGHGDS